MKEDTTNADMGMEVISNANSAEVGESRSRSMASGDGVGKQEEIGETGSSEQSGVDDSPQKKAKEYYVVVGDAKWDMKEMSLLEEAQRLLSTERHSNMAIYIKIAAMLPHKTVRDVAYKFMELNTRAEEEKKIEASQPYFTTGQQQLLSGMAGRTAIASPTLSNNFVHPKLFECMHENATIISKMRENLLSGRLMENIRYMRKFHTNILEVKKYLDAHQLQIPPLPVDVDVRLLQYRNPMQTSTNPTHQNL